MAFQPSDKAAQRAAELVSQNSDGVITTEKQSELDDSSQLKHILILAKARARQRCRELFYAQPADGQDISMASE